MVIQGQVLNRKFAFPRVLSYQNSFLGSKFVVIGGSCCQEMRGSALFHKVLRPLTKYLLEILGFHSKMRLVNMILYAIPGIIFAAVIFTFGTKIEQPIWFSGIFSWVPYWFIVDRYAANSGNLLFLTIILNFIFRGLLLPFTEEIYFRGFLLPRMNKLGEFAPLVSASLFSVYHLFAPWENISRMIAVLPFIYISYRKKIYVLV